MLAAFAALLTTLLLAPVNTAAAENLVWACSGGGWRAMVAQSAYAQVFSKLGILGSTDDSPAQSDDGGREDTTTATPKIKVMAGNSGSTWFLTQFAFSQNYYNTIVDGTPTSLGQFTQAWMEAYATTQSNIPDTCGPLQALCDIGSAVESLAAVTSFIPLALYYNLSWAETFYAMYNATSTMAYNDPNFVSVKASSSEKLSQLSGVDVCVHTALLPNARARDADTITYLVKDYTNASTSYTVPLPYDYCVGDMEATWLPEQFPGGNVYNLNAESSFSGSNVATGFPMYPPKASDGLYVTPYLHEHSNQNATRLSPQDMSPPFGGNPTAVQLGVAASSDLGHYSEELASFYAQFFSVVKDEITSSSLTLTQKLGLKTALDKVQDLLWSTGLLANAAVMSGWTEPNPKTQPPADATNFWFVDGEYTDNSAAAHAIARYQQLYGASNPIKLIITNQNIYSQNLSDILYYFNYAGNKDKSFIWQVGRYDETRSQGNPQMSKQIFEDEMTEELLKGEPVEGTNLTMAVLPVATTIDNEAFSVKAGQQVSVAVINLNSNIPSTIMTESLIQEWTPALVSLAETIASSQDLADKVAAFIGSNTETSTTATPTTTPPSSSSPSCANVIGGEMLTVLSCVGLLLLPLFVEELFRLFW
jgi:hypothetical protein